MESLFQECGNNSGTRDHVSSQTDHAGVEGIARRRSANYHPSVWGDFFLSFSSNFMEESNGKDEEELQYLKEMVKNMLDKTPDNSTEKLDLIDTIQRLGLAYHYENEIKTSLANFYHSHLQFSDDQEPNHDLRTVALQFRLLRHQGYFVPSDVFNKFKDDDEDKLDESVMHDNLRGVLSLYEATHYHLHGESFLDKAMELTTSYLVSLLPKLSNTPNAAEVSHALKYPIHKTLYRVATRLYIPVYESNELHNPVLLRFSKLDFNLMQKLHQKELSNLTKWWKGLDFSKNHYFARDRLAECFFWILGLFFEPKYCIARKSLAKVLAMTALIDDIYDVHGTLDELTPFTDAIQRWDSGAADQLPSYMKQCYHTLLDVYSKMEEDLTEQQNEGSSSRVDFAKTAMKEVVRAYYEEAKWYYSEYVPSLEEYLKVALITAAYKMIAVNSFVALGEKAATKQVLSWFSSNDDQPLIIRASSVICRLMDDMAGHEFEHERGHNATAVECYMKHKENASKQEAYAEFTRMITDAWKDINQERIALSAIPRILVQIIVNMAQVIDLLYKNEDIFTHSEVKFKNMITLLLVDPIKI